MQWLCGHFDLQGGREVVTCEGVEGGEVGEAEGDKRQLIARCSCYHIAHTAHPLLPNPHLRSCSLLRCREKTV